MRVLTITPSVNARVNTRRDGQKHRTFADARNSSRCTRVPLLRRALDLRRARSLGKTRTIAIDDVPGRERGDESRKSAGDVEARAKALAELVKNSDVGNAMSVDDREKVNEGIEALEATQLSDRTCENEGIFGFYDVSYVSVGKNQVGNPAGGRFRSPLGRFLFKTIGLEQNLFAPNRIENRVAFTVLGCLPGEVTLEGTFGAVDGLNDGRTVKADFDPPGISVAGGPKLRIGPKSSVVLSTTYLDESVRLGKGVARESVCVHEKVCRAARAGSSTLGRRGLSDRDHASHRPRARDFRRAPVQDDEEHLVSRNGRRVVFNLVVDGVRLARRRHCRRRRRPGASGGAHAGAKGFPHQGAQ